MKFKRVNILDIVKQYNIPMEQKGSAIYIQCPFHNDHHPSCQIYPETNSFYCWPCQATGFTEKLVAKLEGISYHEACKFLYGKNYEFLKLSSEIDEIEPDKEFMMDRLAEEIKKRARKDINWSIKIPSLFERVLDENMDLIKFQGFIKEIRGE